MTGTSFAQATREASIKGKNKDSQKRGLNYFSSTGNARKKGSLKNFNKANKIKKTTNKYQALKTGKGMAKIKKTKLYLTTPQLPSN